ncbi:unnamed protein product [Rotaria sordida]|uniref:Uncharacterized protein n=1 Tax=Rotaria sordida TaxID=392033 RepID=A0A814U608_9BILA|nr:unnamed protein product [Rotaria sordida]CAF1171385.1 unnamed protein product [Rotaria sordida]CAF1461618.1 unnamed protein product [Rotaria sordida]
MIKIAIFVILICMAISSLRGSDLNGKFGFYYRPVNHITWSSKLCENQTLAQSYLNNTRQLITTFETNGSYTQVLQKRAQAIAYFKNNNNTVLLSSNCSQFFIGLKNARKLDAQALLQQRIYEENAARLYKRILQSLLGFRFFIYDDF